MNAPALGPAVLIGIFLSCPVRLHSAETAEVLKDGTYIQKACQTLRELKGFTPNAEVKLSAYGGWKNRRVKASGFFRVAKIDDRWWVIDPEGCFFLCVGVNTVSPAKGGPDLSPTRENLAWGEEATRQLRKHGFNMAGCWSATEVIRKLSKPIPYCLRWNVSSHYRNERRNKYPATGKFPVIYPFDSEFEAFCEQLFEKAKETGEDPWLFGHFSDNELPLREQGIVNRYLDHAKDDPNHQAAKKFLADRNQDRPGKTDDRDFLHLVVETYYRKVSSALKKQDPNHMYLGTRLHGRALNSGVIFEAAGRHTDVISVNYYHRWTPEHERMENWERLANKPILITEWYAMAADSGLPTNESGSGFSVRTQEDRAKFYQHFTLGLLESPACIGWHWFKYQDGLNNAGIINLENKPYPALWEAMKEINLQTYPLIEFLSDQSDL